ncbi:MAG TPA: glycosyltransferase family A protein, partial [Thermoanaerobaculia bacterium]|nr:glycosyltransferase family A protein [Thermoanaerobaculia bacterium]
MTLGEGAVSASGKSAPLVSVVTPVYNGAETLAQCVESVISQTYRNFEYLIVDNCSSDRTAEVAAGFEKRDSRVRVVHNKKFLKVSENHHAGFREMSPASAYCKIVHADDWIFPECLERMVALGESQPSVGLVGAYRLSERWVTFDGLPYPSTLVDGAAACRRTLLNDEFDFGSPTSTLIRAEVLRSRDHFYDEDSYPFHFDLAVWYEILGPWDFGFVHQVLTFSRCSDSPLTSKAGRLGTKLAERLLMLNDFGPRFLSREELEARRRELLRDYSRFLGRETFLRRGEDFWSYHAAILERLGRSHGALARMELGVMA